MSGVTPTTTRRKRQQPASSTGTAGSSSRAGAGGTAAASASIDEEEERRIRKRLKHNEDENRRRRKLNQQFKELASLVACEKPHKAAVLSAAIDRIQELTAQLQNLSGLGQQSVSSAEALAEERGALQTSTANLGMNLAKNEFEISLDHNLNFRNGCVAMIVSNLQGRIIDANQAFCDLVRYPREVLTSPQNSVFEITHPDSLASSFGLVSSLLQNHSAPHCIAKKYVASDGQVKCAKLISWLSRDTDGQPTYINTVIQVVSKEQMRAIEEAMFRQQQQQQQYRNARSYHYPQQQQPPQQIKMEPRLLHSSSSSRGRGSSVFRIGVPTNNSSDGGGGGATADAGAAVTGHHHPHHHHPAGGMDGPSDFRHQLETGGDGVSSSSTSAGDPPEDPPPLAPGLGLLPDGPVSHPSTYEDIPFGFMLRSPKSAQMDASAPGVAPSSSSSGVQASGGNGFVDLLSAGGGGGGDRGMSSSEPGSLLDGPIFSSMLDSTAHGENYYMMSDDTPRGRDATHGGGIFR